jgi:hypothetical protein
MVEELLGGYSIELRPLHWTATFAVHSLVPSFGSLRVSTLNSLFADASTNCFFNGVERGFHVGESHHEEDKSLVDFVPAFGQLFGWGDSRLRLLFLRLGDTRQEETCDKNRGQDRVMRSHGHVLFGTTLSGEGRHVPLQRSKDSIPERHAIKAGAQKPRLRWANLAISPVLGANGESVESLPSASADTSKGLANAELQTRISNRSQEDGQRAGRQSVVCYAKSFACGGFVICGFIRPLSLGQIAR